jgi:uncharacterized protein YggE
MDTLQNHKVWKIVGLIIVILIVAKIFGGGHDEWRGNDKPVNTITVSGTGEVVVKPDIATISFGVSAENLDVAKAQSDSATKMNSIIEALKKNGVDEKDIKTTNYSIYPRYDYTKVASPMYPYGGKQVLAAYVVSQTVEVKIRDISKSGAILSSVGGLGVTDISGLNFSVDKIKDVQNDARDLAIKDARAQAEVLAKGLGVKLVKITSFSEGNRSPIYYGMMEKAVSAPMMDSVAPSVPAGENKITSNVTITYEIR